MLVRVVTVTVIISAVTGIIYQPNWKSLQSRPLPQWFDDSKFGIMIHWGVYSVPSFSDNTKYQEEWFWYAWKNSKPSQDIVDFMAKNYRPDFTYADFAPMFTAELFDPDEWAELFAASGARYIAFTAKHHEGFTMWPSKVSFNWNAMDVGPRRDLVGELAAALRNKTDIRFGVYHSLYEWFNPLFNKDSDNHFKTQYFVASKTLPELYELVNTYKPDLIWSDGDWSALADYWNSTHFLAWLYNESPVKDHVVVNDRWGLGTWCRHGGYYNCEDRYNPKKLQPFKWENVWFTDRKSCGFRRNAELADYFTVSELLETATETISCGGNFLLNVGPTHDGRIVPIVEERLRQIGSWLKVNGEAVYKSKPWKYQQDSARNRTWYTSRPAKVPPAVYAIFFEWPTGDTMTLGDITPTNTTVVTLVGYPQLFRWTPEGSKGIILQIPPIPANKMPCRWAWVFKFENVD